MEMRSLTVGSLRKDRGSKSPLVVIFRWLAATPATAVPLALAALKGMYKNVPPPHRQRTT